MLEDESLIVLVSSNGGGSGIRDVVASFNNDRIRLVETKNFMPMALHWEFACSNAVGDVISIIGDDDAVVPGTAQTVASLFNNYPAAECITQSPAHYYWPDYPICYCANKYREPECKGDVIELEPFGVLKKVIEMREWYGKLPYLYHGFVKRDVLERIRLNDGSIFKRIAPDIYSDFALATHIKSYIRANYCLTVGGQGAKSNGANFILNTELGKDFLKDLPEALKPRLTGKSINLQIYEYSRLFIPSTLKRSEINSTWSMFVLRTLFEAAKNAENKDEILIDLYKVLNDEVNPIKLFFFNLLIKLVKVNVIAVGITYLNELRQKRIMKSWSDASYLNATNVFHVAQYISKSTK